MLLLAISGFVFDAALIGVILVAMTGEFPGWGMLCGCVIAMGIAGNAVAYFLPWPVSLLSLIVSAAVGGAIISWTELLSFRRASIAAGTYLGSRVVLTILFVAMVR